MIKGLVGGLFECISSSDIDLLALFDSLIFASRPLREMLLVAVVMLVLCSSVSSQLSVFDPPSFAEYSCTGNYKWTTWFDTNDPSLVQGDFEVTNHIQQLFSTFMCAAPSAIEVC